MYHIRSSYEIVLLEFPGLATSGAITTVVENSIPSAESKVCDLVLEI